MEYTVKRTFTYNGGEYEVRSWKIEGSTKVKAFKKDGTAADPYEFSVTSEIQCDARANKGAIDPLEELVKTAEAYVRNDTWGEYLKAVKALEENGE